MLDFDVVVYEDHAQLTANAEVWVAGALVIVPTAWLRNSDRARPGVERKSRVQAIRALPPLL